jgi:hypothetical protein
MLTFARLTFFVGAVFCVLGTSCDAVAQDTISNYAARQLKNIENRNSSQNFTSSRYNSRAIRQGVPNVGVAGVNMQSYSSTGAILAGPRQPLVGGGGGIGGKSKPFSRIDRGPTVSPYLALNNPFSTAEDYYNIVKPLQEQRRTNDAFSRQQYAQQRKLNQIAAQGPYQITGNANAAPTGHSAGFMQMGSYMNTGGYFAPPTQPKSQR